MFGVQLLRAAAIKRTSKKRKGFGGKLALFCMALCEFSCVTHTWLRADWHVAHRCVPCVSPGRFLCIIAPAGRAGSSLTSAVLSGGLVLGTASWRWCRAPPGWISKAFSHELPCHRTSLCPWQVCSAIKPAGDLCDHLDYKSALLIHLFLS